MFFFALKNENVHNKKKMSDNFLRSYNYKCIFFCCFKATTTTKDVEKVEKKDFLNVSQKQSIRKHKKGSFRGDGKMHAHIWRISRMVEVELLLLLPLRKRRRRRSQKTKAKQRKIQTRFFSSLSFSHSLAIFAGSL